ncbi:MlaE family ABC transporter permease, partial [Nodularia sp. UHCC 0506]|uniref:MlaE family ABC transporter permease n=1 Tax=Nodularia sp. UHCC 0506 TaxID=3110243 RepID=UPI002B1F0F8C
ACILMMPIMMVFALIMGIAGGVFAAAQFYNIDPEAFLESVRTFLEPSDLLMVLVKGLIFGAIVAINGCSWGLTTKGGAKEVGESATTAVVTTWVLIFMTDFFISVLMFDKNIP